MDAISAVQAALEKQQLTAGQPHTFTEEMAEFRKTAEVVHYQSSDRRLPGYLYRPAGDGLHPPVLWNHGSEKEPKAQSELARFYT